MANPKGNPQNFPKRSSNEARKNGAKGGEKSGEVRAFKKNFRETFRATTTQEEIEAMIRALKEKASNGDVQAWIALRDLNGEKPTDKMALSGTDGGPIQNNFTVTFVRPDSGSKDS